MSFVKIKDQVTKGGKNKPLFSSNFRVKLHEDDWSTKSLSSLVKADDDGSQDIGYLSGYMSTWGNSDSVGDIVRKGAFTKTLTERRPRVLWQHDAYKPIGVIKEAYEDEKGLFAVIALNLDTQLGLEAYNLYKTGAMDSFSVGIQLEKYNVIKADDGSSAYEILETKLWEVSAVTFPANEQAIVTSVKEHYEEVIGKNTDLVTNELEKSESIDDLISALQDVKKSNDSSIGDFFFEKSVESPEEIIEAANNAVESTKSKEQQLADILSSLD